MVDRVGVDAFRDDGDSSAYGRTLSRWGSGNDRSLPRSSSSLSRARSSPLPSPRPLFLLPVAEILPPPPPSRPPPSQIITIVSFLLLLMCAVLTLAALLPSSPLVVAVRRSAADDRSYRRRCLPFISIFFLLLLFLFPDHSSDSWCSLEDSDVFLQSRFDRMNKTGSWLTKASADGLFVFSRFQNSDAIIGIIIRLKIDLAQGYQNFSNYIRIWEF